MKCLKCNGTEFSTRKIRFTPELKGETLEVISFSYVCNACGEAMMDSEQMNALRRAAADQYRHTHNLLTSREIIALRDKLGMSQAEFARYLKVGEASIKRWETYYIQEEGQDEHIRLKSDEAAAEFNALEIHWKNSSEDMFSGNRKFNFELFKNVILALIKFCQSPLFLNKALFFADFLHYKNHAKSLTGSRYVALEYGPCPDQFQGIYQLLEGKGIVRRTGKHNLIAAISADWSIFDDREQNTLQTVINQVKLDGGQNLYEKSHKESAYKNTAYLDMISYKYAKYLTI